MIVVAAASWPRCSLETSCDWMPDGDPDAALAAVTNGRIRAAKNRIVGIVCRRPVMGNNTRCKPIAVSYGPARLVASAFARGLRIQVKRPKLMDPFPARAVRCTRAPAVRCHRAPVKNSGCNWCRGLPGDAPSLEWIPVHERGLDMTLICNLRG